MPDIIQIIQYLTPDSLTSLLQHFGRCGRAGQRARAIFFVEPSVFQAQRKRRPKKQSKKSRGKRKRQDDDSSEEEMAQVQLDEDELALLPSEAREEVELEWKKNVEAPLRAWIETDGCRRPVAQVHFNNPPRIARESFLLLLMFISLIF